MFYVAILCMHMNIISLLKSCRCSNNWSSSETVSLISILEAERELLCGSRAVCLLYFSTISQWINIWYFQPNMFTFMSIKKNMRRSGTLSRLLKKDFLPLLSSPTTLVKLLDYVLNNELFINFFHHSSHTQHSAEISSI